MKLDVVSKEMVVARVAYQICLSSLRVVTYIIQVSRLYATPISSYCKNAPLLQ